MSYGQDGTVVKLGADGGLDQVVCLKVNGCSGLVQNQNLRLPEQCSGKAYKLALAKTSDIPQMDNQG